MNFANIFNKTFLKVFYSNHNGSRNISTVYPDALNRIEVIRTLQFQ